MTSTAETAAYGTIAKQTADYATVAPLPVPLIDKIVKDAPAQKPSSDVAGPDGDDGLDAIRPFGKLDSFDNSEIASPELKAAPPPPNSESSMMVTVPATKSKHKNAKKAHASASLLVERSSSRERTAAQIATRQIRTLAETEHTGRRSTASTETIPSESAEPDTQLHEPSLPPQEE